MLFPQHINALDASQRSRRFDNQHWNRGDATETYKISWIAPLKSDLIKINCFETLSVPIVFVPMKILRWIW